MSYSRKCNVLPAVLFALTFTGYGCLSFAQALGLELWQPQMTFPAEPNFGWVIVVPNDARIRPSHSLETIRSFQDQNSPATHVETFQSLFNDIVDIFSPRGERKSGFLIRFLSLIERNPFQQILRPIVDKYGSVRLIWSPHPSSQRLYANEHRPLGDVMLGSPFTLGADLSTLSFEQWYQSEFAQGADLHLDRLFRSQEKESIYLTVADMEWQKQGGTHVLRTQFIFALPPDTRFTLGIFDEEKGVRFDDIVFPPAEKKGSIPAFRPLVFVSTLTQFKQSKVLENRALIEFGSFNEIQDKRWAPTGKAMDRYFVPKITGKKGLIPIEISLFNIEMDLKSPRVSGVDTGVGTQFFSRLRFNVEEVDQEFQRELDHRMRGFIKEQGDQAYGIVEQLQKKILSDIFDLF